MYVCVYVQHSVPAANKALNIW